MQPLVVLFIALYSTLFISVGLAYRMVWARLIMEKKWSKVGHFLLTFLCAHIYGPWAGWLTFTIIVELCQFEMFYSSYTHSSEGGFWDQWKRLLRCIRIYWWYEGVLDSGINGLGAFTYSTWAP